MNAFNLVVVCKHDVTSRQSRGELGGIVLEISLFLQTKVTLNLKVIVMHQMPFVSSQCYRKLEMPWRWRPDSTGELTLTGLPQPSYLDIRGRQVGKRREGNDGRERTDGKKERRERKGIEGKGRGGEERQRKRTGRKERGG